jgi:hypothetical protein
MPVAAAQSPEPLFAVEVDSMDASAWDAMACEFDDLTTDQLAHFVDGHWDVGRGSHLVLRRDGHVVAGARLVILTLPGMKRGLAYCRFGPIWRRHGTAVDPATYRSALQALHDEYCVKRGHYLTVIPRPHPAFYGAEIEALTSFGFTVRRGFEDTNRYLVEILKSSDAQMSAFEQKWRYNLKQSKRNAFDVRICPSPDGAEMFCRLYQSMTTRKGFYANDPIHLISQLAIDLPEPLRPHVVMAFHDDRPIVGAVVAILGDTAYYVFGASADSALPLKAGYALHWWITRWLSDINVRWYDLGGEALSQGLRQFKKGFVGRSGSIVYMEGEYDIWPDYQARFAADAIYLMRAGRRAYRKLRYFAD